MARKWQFRWVLRYIFALVAFVSMAVFAVSVWHGFATTPDTMDIVEYDAYRATALQFLRDDAKLFGMLAHITMIHLRYILAMDALIFLDYGNTP